MYRIKAPASTSNLSAGFDVLGLALDIYNCFKVESGDKDTLINVEERYNNEDNDDIRGRCALRLDGSRRGLQGRDRSREGPEG